MLIAQILPKHCSKLQKTIEIMSEKPSWEMFFFWWPPMFNVDWLKVWINTINCLIFRRQQDSIPPKVLEVSEIVDAIVSANIIAATLQSFNPRSTVFVTTVASSDVIHFRYFTFGKRFEIIVSTKYTFRQLNCEIFKCKHLQNTSHGFRIKEKSTFDKIYGIFCVQ